MAEHATATSDPHPAEPQVQMHHGCRWSSGMVFYASRRRLAGGAAVPTRQPATLGDVEIRSQSVTPKQLERCRHKQEAEITSYYAA